MLEVPFLISPNVSMLLSFKSAKSVVVVFGNIEALGMPNELVMIVRKCGDNHVN